MPGAATSEVEITNISQHGFWLLLDGTTTDAGEAVGGRPEPSADLLRQLDEDPLRAADVAEPIAVFVALHLANELRAAGSQASDDGVDIVDCECDMADAGGVRRRVPVAAPARRGVILRQLEPSVAVRLSVADRLVGTRRPLV
jgi:hypothetical protein